VLFRSVDVETGEEIATSVCPYSHGVMDEKLPDGTKLGPDWALQHPQDYIDSMVKTVRDVIEMSKVKKEDIIGLGIDFTACTMMPIKKDGTPLCFLEKYKSNPNAYVKLWKHHAAQKYADKLNQIATERGEKFLQRYGGKISSEWLFPKIMQILDESPEIYEEADRFIEAADWIVFMLTGEEKRNSCTAGYKAIWSKSEGYPSNDFFKALDPRLENVVDEKLSRQIYSLGLKAGNLTNEMAEKMNLTPNVSVAIANVDAHVSVPAVGITDIGKMLMIIGTSTCHMLLWNEEKLVPGICGYVEDGILPGFYGYEAGQSCVGDHFEWVVKNCVPPSYYDEAKEKDLNIYQLLTQKAMNLKPGESGLLALDWWNGNRSILVDADLTGLILGMTLTTKPEEIYRALIEATAYGTKLIIDNFKEHGIDVNELYACGGIAEKDKLLMQIYADVTNLEIKVSASPQTPALGSAMFGAVAAGKENGGYDSIFEAAKKMAKLKDFSYKPIAENVATYEKLYQEYRILHDYFGRGQNNVMKRIKEIKREISR